VRITAVSTVWNAESTEMPPTRRISRKSRHSRRRSARAGRSALERRNTTTAIAADARPNVVT
jgi:hypothetical protein